MLQQSLLALAYLMETMDEHEDRIYEHLFSPGTLTVSFG